MTDNWKVEQGDCRDIMRTLPDNSVDAIVSDPPYGLSFMGKAWDHGVPGVEFWTEAMRVAKPGAHLVAFGGTRTYHRLAVAIEDAGWDVRDCLSWLYGSGFPKSLAVDKAIDKRGGQVADFATFRDAVKESMKKNGISRNALQFALGNHMLSHYLTAGSQPAVPNWRDYQIIRDTVQLGSQFDEMFAEAAKREVVGQKDSNLLAVAPGQDNDRSATTLDITAPATDAAKRWHGWGTALKPAWEPIILARKPLTGTVAANVTQYGTGAINVDGCRIGTTDKLTAGGMLGVNAGDTRTGKALGMFQEGTPNTFEQHPSGRWPANVLLDEDAAGLLDAQAGERGSFLKRNHDGKEGGWPGGERTVTTYGDSGGPSRFFYTAKVSRKEREAGLDGMPRQIVGSLQGGGVDANDPVSARFTKSAANVHPTVKPIALMRWLCRLVTPPNGLILDPFNGSGSTGCAAVLEGFRYLGCELEAEYVEIAQRRIAYWEGQRAEPDLFG